MAHYPAPCAHQLTPQALLSVIVIVIVIGTLTRSYKPHASKLQAKPYDRPGPANAVL
jgi:hypothetical protein